MTKITEASSLSSLGLSKDQIRGIYKSSGLALRHNMEFDEVKTKSQALSRLKRGHFIVAVRDGEAMVLYNRRGGYQIASPDGKSYHKSMKDALAEVPGKGWTYYSSKADNSDYTPLQKDPERDREESHGDVVRPVMKQLNRVYGDAARKLGAQAAEDIRNEAVKYFDAADSDYTGYIGKDYADQLRKSYKAFKTLADSDRPFDTITGYTFNRFGAKEFSEYVNDQLKLSSKRYDWGSPSKIERFIKNAKLPLAKIARYGLNLIKKERDYVLRNAPDFKQTHGPAKLDKIKKAWESYKETGNVNILAEAFDEKDSLLGNLGQDIKRKATGRVTDKYHVLSMVDEYVERAIKTAEWALEDDWEDKEDALKLIRSELIELKKWIRNRNK